MKRLFVFIVVIISASLIVGCSRQISSGTENTAGLGGKQKFLIGYTNVDDTDAVSINRKVTLMRYAQTDPNIEMNFVDDEKNINKQLDQID